MTYIVALKAGKNKDCVGIASEPYLMFAGYVSLAEQWLKMEATAAKMLEKNPNGPDADFYKGKIHAADFYFETILPRVNMLVPQILANPNSILEIKPEQFVSEN